MKQRGAIDAEALQK